MADVDQQKLLLTIDANVELLRRSLNQAERDVGQFERRVNQSTGGVDAAFGKMQRSGVAALGALSGAIASIGAVGFAQVGRQILQFADDLSTAADQANITVERYQTLREGLRKLELSTEQTDTVLKRLSATLGEVQGGTAAGGVVDALERMGITSKIFNGEIQTTDELLDAIAAASKRYSTEAQFTADVVELVGRKVGIDLAAALRDGGVALKEQEQAFRDAGAVITEEYVSALADANEELDAFGERNKAFWAILAVDTAKGAANVAAAIGNAWRGVGPGLEELIEADAEAALQRALNRSSDRLGTGSGTVNFRLEPRSRPVLPARTARSSSARTRPAGSRSAPARSARPGASDADRIADARAEQFQGVAGRLTAEAANPLSAVTAEFDAVQAAAVRAGESISQSFEGAREFASDISRNLAQSIVFGNDIGKALVNSFKAAAAEALSNGLFDLLLGRNGNGGLIGSIVAGFGATFGGARAMGGPVSAGRAYLVGERGPELIVPQVPGRVLNGGQIAAMGGGRQTVDVNVQPSPLFVTTVSVTAQQAGAQAAQGVVRRATRGSVPGSRGA